MPPFGSPLVMGRIPLTPFSCGVQSCARNLLLRTQCSMKPLQGGSIGVPRSVSAKPLEELRQTFLDFRDLRCTHARQQPAALS